MSSLSDIRLPLDSGQIYHIYNKGNDGQLIFYNDAPRNRQN